MFTVLPCCFTANKWGQSIVILRPVLIYVITSSLYPPPLVVSIICGAKNKDVDINLYFNGSSYIISGVKEI